MSPWLNKARKLLGRTEKIPLKPKKVSTSVSPNEVHWEQHPEPLKPMIPAHFGVTANMIKRKSLPLRKAATKLNTNVKLKAALLARFCKLGTAQEIKKFFEDFDKKAPKLLLKYIAKAAKSKNALKTLFESNPAFIRIPFNSPREGNGRAYFVDAKTYPKSTWEEILKANGFEGMIEKPYYLGYHGDTPVRIYFVDGLNRYLTAKAILGGIQSA
ncbi:MAG: hypothetical protein ABIH20_04195 [Candidatus Diapherotrites archaeon]